jgi:hypothetical protein
MVEGGGADAQDGPVACPGMRGTAARCFHVAVPPPVGARSGKSAGHFRLYALLGKAGELCGDRSSVRRISTRPASWGENGHSRAGCPWDDGIADAGNGCARTGAVRARDGPRPGTAGRGLPGYAGEERPRTQLPGCGMLLQNAARDGPG